MGWQKWVNVEAWEAASHHVTSVLPFYLAFFALYFIVSKAFPDGWFKTILEYMDQFLILGVFAILGLKVLKVAWSWFKEGDERHLVVA